MKCLTVHVTSMIHKSHFDQEIGFAMLGVLALRSAI